MDNGEDIIEGLNNIFKIRENAILNFSEFNIKSGEPYSVLEDLFVPLYFMHRYQTEAVVKLIGGMDYNYATRGDKQMIVEDLDFEIQNRALVSVFQSLEAKNLVIPRRILKLFPPRAYGFPRTRESFKGKTGISFDTFSAASTASEMTISLLLNTKRLNRIKIQNSIDSSKMSLRYLLSGLISNSFKKTYEDPYLSEVQHLINTNILIYLLNITEDEEAFMQVKHEAIMAVKYLKRLITKSKKIHAYYDQYSYIIEDFKKRPDLYKKQRSPKIPDGSPIGSQ